MSRMRVTLSVQVRWTTAMTPHVSLKFWGHVFLLFSSALANDIHIAKEYVLLYFSSKEGLFLRISDLIFQGKRQQKADNEIIFQ